MIAIIASLGLFSAQAQTPPDPKELERKVTVLLEQAYRRPDVRAFCIQNPDSVNALEIGGVTIVVRCKAWREWHEQKG